MSEPDDSRRLIEDFAWMWHAFGERDVEGAVRLAADALVLGLDSPSLRELAGLSVHDHDHVGVRRLIQDVIRDFGADVIQPDTAEVARLAIRVACDEWLKDQLGDREFLSRVYGFPDSIPPDLFAAGELIEMPLDHPKLYGSKADDLRAEARVIVESVLGQLADTSPVKERPDRISNQIPPTGTPSRST